MQLFKRFIIRIGSAHYYHDGSGRVRDLGPLTAQELRSYAKREQVPLIDQRIVLPESPARPASPEPRKCDVAYHERKIVGRY